MDRLVDQAGGPGATPRGGTTEMDETRVLDATGESDEQDIESELYCSTREAGIVAVGFAPMPDV